MFTGVLYKTVPRVAPFRLPGTADGHNFVVSYLPNRAAEHSDATKPTEEPTPPATKSPLATLRTQAARPSTPASTSTAPSPNPNAAAGADALGTGNITLALTSYFPTPKPDLSALPHGTKGDVILDVVIDPSGKISDLKMMSGVGYGVDETVIATVRQWTFRPALQNGNPVASEQEILFHYERS